MKHEAKIAPSGITVSMKEAKNRLTELARRVEEGETVTVTATASRCSTWRRTGKKAG